MSEALSKLASLSGLDPADAVKAWAHTEGALPFSARMRNRPAVEDSADLQRIVALERRPPVDLDNSPQALALVELMTRRLKRHRAPGTCACASMGRDCIVRLNPSQAWTLYEAPLAEGIVGSVGVGEGKSLLDILIAMVLLQANEVAVLFVPPRLRQQLHREYLLVREHFHVPTFIMDNIGYWVEGAPVLRVIPYSKFSRPESTDLLKRLKPRLIIGDEAHYLRHKNTARTGRALAYFAEDETSAMSCWWSGSLAADSIKNFAHLSALGLGPNSPLPIKPQTVEEWSCAVDPIDSPAPAGALNQLRDHNNAEYGAESIRAALHRRIVETRGFISTKRSSIKAAIKIYERIPPQIPENLSKMLDDLRGGWVRPDGEELVDPLSVARSARELACGFFYRWKFPHGEPRELIMQWFELRKAWHKELREKLKEHLPFMDSPLLATKAAIRAYRNKDEDEDEWVERYLSKEGFDEEDDAEDDGRRPKWKAQTWPAWREISDKVYHESEAVWVSDYLVRDAAQWALENRGVVWYMHATFGQAIAQLSGLPLYAGGDAKHDTLHLERGDRSVICSINAHGTGTDGLQRIFNEALVANSPSSADRWEQLIGRLHRLYQPKDQVIHRVYRHTEELAAAIDKALNYAQFVEGIMGVHQKLIRAECSFV